MSEPVRLANIDREYASLGVAVDVAVKRVFESGVFILGPQVTALETELAGYLGVKHVVTCANGTDALVLALRALGVGPGDEVIVPAFTFAATAEAVAWVGAVPVFADIERDSFLMDIGDARRRVTPRTRAVIAVHLFGHCVDGEALRIAFAGTQVRIVEDAAQAIGADDGSARAGAIGDVACFSFYPTKNLGGPGDGGMVSTNDAALADTLRLLRAHGTSSAYMHEVVGTNSRLDEIQATVLRLKLPSLDAWNDRRRANACAYREAAEATGLRVPEEPSVGSHAYHHFTIRTRSRDGFIERLKKSDIGHGVYYALPLHQQAAFRSFVPAGLSLPNAEEAAAEVVSVPVHQWLTSDEVNRVAEVIHSWREPARYGDPPDQPAA